MKNWNELRTAILLANTKPQWECAMRAAMLAVLDEHEAAQTQLAEALKRIDVLDNALTLETERANDYRDAVEALESTNGGDA